jgi:hypothetical protein
MMAGVLLGVLWLQSSLFPLLHLHRPRTSTDDAEADLATSMDLIHTRDALLYTHRLYAIVSTALIGSFHL